MAMLGRWTKQPGETIAYPVDYAEWLAERPGNVITAYAVAAEPGISIASHVKTGAIITVLLAGGVSGTNYKITITTTTDVTGEVKESEFVVKVKEV